MSFFSSIGHFFGTAYHDFGRLGGNDASGQYSAWGMMPTQAAKDKAKVEQDKAVAQGIIDQNIAAMGGDVAANAERRRRYGFLSTILAGSLPSLGMGLGGTDTTKKNKLG